MPIMEVVLEQEYLGQNIINRFNYLATGTPSAVMWSIALVNAIGAIESAGVYPPTGLMKTIANMQDNSVNFVQVTARDVYSNVDFYEAPFVVPLVGQNGATGGAPFTSLGFRTNRTRNDIRRGTKRFVGVPLAQLNEGGVVGGTLAGLMANVATVMTDVLEYDDEGNTLSFAPIVCGKEKYLPEGNVAPNYAYRYYETEEEQEDWIMQSIIWDYYTTLRSQTSRQYGRGR